MTHPVDALVAAIAALEPKPRSRRWTSLTYCIVDATWSIGAHYDRVVVPLVHRVASVFEDSAPTVPAQHQLPPDPAPTMRFLREFRDTASLVSTTNRQRTSTRGGVLKAEAALAHVSVFDKAGISTLHDASALLSDHSALDTVDKELAQIPGEGFSGVRRGYLWMLIGDDHNIKPDRMVLRWLRRHGVTADERKARHALREVAARLSTDDAPVTPWMVDHAIWMSARTAN